MSVPVYCRHCGTVAKPQKRTRGWFALELLLWLLFIVPGLCYTLWRVTSRVNVCRQCGSEDIIPADSPVAVDTIGRSRPVQPERTEEPTTATRAELDSPPSHRPSWFR